MHSALIHAVLSSSPDYDLLLDSLCWPAESWPQTERVEALTALVQALRPALTDSDSDAAPAPLTAASRSSIRDRIESVIWARCLPFLCRISAEPGDEARCRESAAAVCGLLGACVGVCGEGVRAKVVSSTLQSLQRVSEEEMLAPGTLSVQVATEVLAALMPLLTADEKLTLDTLNCALSSIRSLPDDLVSKVVLRVILTLLSCCGEASSDRVPKRVLEHVCSWHSTERTPGVTRRTLLCLTVLSDHLLDSHSPAPSRSRDPRLCPQFWRMVQDGLTHGDSLTRKRALYLLKRCAALSEVEGFDCQSSTSEEGETLFKWAPDKSRLLREFWEDYTLVMETLEENQVHVVRPVLNRIDALIQATVDDGQGSGLFHPCWLLCVYQRMFHSENKSLMREGVCHLLELRALQQPAFAAAFSQFVVGSFMNVLSETSLFCRSPGQSVGECPELAVKLQDFLVTFFTSLPPEDRGRVLLQLIQQLGSKHWCAVPLLFVCQALSRLPPSPLLRNSGLAALREVLRCTMITHQVLLRGAAQCFLLNGALSLTDVSEVTRDDLFSFLMHFRADESLCRGTELWNEVCSWLLEHECSFKSEIRDGDGLDQKETMRPYVQQEVLAYLRVPASTGQPERLPDAREADKLARAILLCVDAERRRLGAESSDALEPLLSPLLDTLSRVYTNIYLPVRKSDKSLQLTLRLLQLCSGPRGHRQEDDVTSAIERAFFKLVEPIQNFILRRLCGELQEIFDVERADLYLCVLRQLAVLCSSPSRCSRNIQHYACPKLIKYSLSVLLEPTQQIPSVASQVSKAVSMASLAAVSGLLRQGGAGMPSETVSALRSLNDYFYTSGTSSEPQPSLGNINKRLVKPQLLDGSSDLVAQGLLQQDWGRIAANFLRDQWICLNFLIRAVGTPESAEMPKGCATLGAALRCGVEALALLPSDLVLPVLSFMKAALPRLVDDEEDLCVQALTMSWELVQGLSTNAHDFWPALKAFVSLAFQHKLLSPTPHQAPTLANALKKVFAELLELSQSKGGVFGVLLQHCCQTWLPSEQGSGEQADAVFSSVFNHLDIVSEACVYGPVFRRDQRLVQDVQTYVEQLGEKCTANVTVASDNRDDQLPRVCVLAFLSRLDPYVQQHQRLMEELVMELLRKDRLISRSKVRYYSNSLQHRVKNRAWQTLLLLLPKLREEFVATLLDHVFEAGFSSNQPSVKYLIEWAMILILVKYPHHLDRFWTCFSLDQEKTKTSVCTFLSVLVHLSVIVPHVEEKVVQLRKALDVILQSCFNHNFSVRLYALLALKRVWSLAESLTEEADAFRGLSSVVTACLSQAEAMQSSGNANKNWVRIQRHFFFSAFHPISDYSVETIFHTFPSLSELADDEWVPPWKFEKLSFFSQSPSLPLRNATPDLGQLQPGDWVQQDQSEQDKEERWAEVQKKITPWRLGVHEQEPELKLVPAQRAARLGKQHGALLVVASLIDKPTNLGGLCRTCEIFGASGLVLDTLHHLNDKHFQSLSVSSELWLPLLEVKPVELSGFLQVKKSEGYCIVGVEQTANSQSLQDFKFPEKTLLLLGNEREGIPANLLQMLDVCVEIPQQGIIRSLNVHVSAALLIWEYTRQHLIPGSNEGDQQRG
ncbi:LOW QUALITY PROTEIN: probable methyltransferase TARBP1 [Fundulus heteroclitus]|uniref:LOW QUALITY PROTEIN: probable methyltransferase TARBP1 n=1 Tax=Fundulus heteroclitus TaxID=8078 RepID=UPI00165C0FE4|nr:LOW QUALITY PROTEIN: probable methyltransferase TARBP1 [Fundulus heteroclitus]